VSSDNAPNVIASQIKPQIGRSFKLLSELLDTSTDGGAVGTSDVTELTAVFELAELELLAPASLFDCTFESDGEGVGVIEGVGVGDLLAPPVMIVNDAVKGTVFGGRHTVSLQT